MMNVAQVDILAHFRHQFLSLLARFSSLSISLSYSAALLRFVRLSCSFSLTPHYSILILTVSMLTYLLSVTIMLAWSQSN